MGDGAFDAMTYAGRVVFVLALLFLFAFWVRRRWGTGTPGGDPGRLRIVESLSLGPQRQVHVIAVGKRRFLIGATPQQVTLLARLDESSSQRDGPPADEGDGDEGGTGLSFETMLQKAEGGTPAEDETT